MSPNRSMSTLLSRLMLAAGLLASVGAALAADAPAAPIAASAVASPAKKALIQKVLTLQQPGIEAIARALVEQPVAPMVQQVSMIIQTRVPPEKREALQKDLQGDLKKYMDAALPLVRDKAVAAAPSTIGSQLDQKFSEEELRQLVTWLESPVARKYQFTLPEFQKALTDKLVADTRTAIEPKLRDLDSVIGKRLAAVAPPANPAAPAPAGTPAKP
ncbi:DUF2059 domain-containing protein [Leptothrix discophora]|uniref:DUF2059 domain-containing protein n=1 Tax=Leptothrix discophora TaxID=89 RepID=A0ABT9G677_LEPDI|nr:hypothetical protein [Leptothrix discophora]MDP4301986.1 hypothetical protein [Leptothrix discophora]